MTRSYSSQVAPPTLCCRCPCLHQALQQINDLFEAIREILTSGGRTLAQGALAWIWARSAQTIPIPGFKTVKQVEENCKAMEFGPLSKKRLEEIDALLAR